MPATQTSYGPAAAAYEGMIASAELATAISRNAEDAAGIGFGKAAFQGTAEAGIRAAGSVFRGVTLVDHNARPANGDAYARGDSVPVLIRGVVWITVVNGVAAGAPAYVTGSGGFTANASGTTAIPNASFDSSASAGGLAKLRLK
ncbi:structural cement protein Gp24 [Methylobacterium oryzihabitans]|uniref:DUF2190 domain-containing protein n=1 Tax=Methylobacterium oryzihabitans TaxID=2499852 RepID=A0A437PHP3_9HYPH|nr:hypothetical protein [Methylobacterium oryzihabitans]RVU21788.1 hypothetical protein EOE48_01705 [Methylobacterium oryzihabitans]